MTAVGLIGTTIVPYNLFLHASGSAERFKDPDQVSDARFDTILSIGLGGIISMAILICAAANIYGTGIEVTNGKDMAVALTPVLGSWATWLIGLGLLLDFQVQSRHHSRLLMQSTVLWVGRSRSRMCSSRSSGLSFW